MSTREFTIEAYEFENRTFTLDVSYEFEWENDGIGGYEYWGAKGFDKGNTYAVVEDYSIDYAVETFPDGTEETVTDSELLARLAKSIHKIVDKDAEDAEPDDYAPDND